MGRILRSAPIVLEEHMAKKTKSTKAKPRGPTWTCYKCGGTFPGFPKIFVQVKGESGARASACRKCYDKLMPKNPKRKTKSKEE